MRLGRQGGKQLKAYAQLGAVGLEVGISTVVGLLGGRWLDEKLGTEPTIAIVGLLLGVFAGFRSLVRVARKVTREMSEEPPPDDHTDGNHG